MDSARLEAHEEWAKTQRHGRPYISNIKGSLKKKVDDAQKGDFGPLFIAAGVTAEAERSLRHEECTTYSMFGEAPMMYNFDVLLFLQ
eukprot:scaffold3158_cov107-Skeletonema_dohrnii-CCMP3373.AAC.2